MVDYHSALSMLISISNGRHTSQEQETMQNGILLLVRSFDHGNKYIDNSYIQISTSKHRIIVSCDTYKNIAYRSQ